MFSFTKILIPVDFSPRCAWAARYGAQLADRFGSQLLFLHAGSSNDQTDLDAFLARELPDTRHRRMVACGDAAENIVKAALQEAVDLILMPTHAHGRFRRFLLGSVTAKVLHDAECPVWTGVHQEEAPAADAVFHNVVCAVDLDPDCVHLIRWAADLSASLGASLKIVHALPAADAVSENRGEIELRRYLFRRAEEELARLRQVSGLDLAVALTAGEVARVVREAALRESAELVVIGRGHTRRALGRLRTNAYSIIRESPCPVVSV